MKAKNNKTRKMKKGGKDTPRKTRFSRAISIFKKPKQDKFFELPICLQTSPNVAEYKEKYADFLKFNYDKIYEEEQELYRQEHHISSNIVPFKLRTTKETRKQMNEKAKERTIQSLLQLDQSAYPERYSTNRSPGKFGYRPYDCPLE